MSTQIRSVRQALEAFAHEHSVPVGEVIRAKLDEHLESSLPPRYRQLAADVLLRLPEGWDSHAHWTMRAGAIPHPIDRIQAGARWLKSMDSKQAGEIQQWEVVLVIEVLDGSPDAAVRWVIAHELAHVATGLESDPRWRDETLAEDRADHLATVWGFGDDHDVCLREEARQKTTKRTGPAR